MITKADFEPIVAAVPSFQQKWNQLLETFDEWTVIGVEFSLEMTEHLVTSALAGDFNDFKLLFAALETPLSDTGTELHDSLTMGFLEDLIHHCEREHINLERVTNCITGHRMQQEWNWAYNYTHAGREPNTGGPTTR